jgi:hypothetical protein
MTTSGSNITKTSITATMASTRDYYNGLVVWSASSNPFNPAYGSYGSNPAQGSASGEANSDFAADITDTNITASTLVTNFKSYATALSRIRYCRLIQWYNYNGSYGAIYDNTQITSTGQGAYQADMSGVSTSGVDAGTTIQAANIDNFVQNLSNAIAANRDSTLTFNEYYCHSSCHGNCHGSI